MIPSCLLSENIKLYVCLFLLVTFLPAGAGAEIYRYIDKDGTVHFTDAVTDLDNAEGVEVINSREDSTDYETLAEHYALRFGLEPALVKRVIEVESGWNPYAVSRSGAMGLMQLMPETAKLLGVRNPFDPEENIRAGVRYLRYLIDLFGGDIEKALAAYNAGPRMVQRHQGVPPIKETIRYLKKVGISRFKREKTQRIYRGRLPDGTILFTNAPFEGLREF